MMQRAAERAGDERLARRCRRTAERIIDEFGTEMDEGVRKRIESAGNFTL